MNHKITDRIIRKIGIPGTINEWTERLSFSELQSLMLNIFEKKIRTKKPGKLLSENRNSRFTRPSDVDPTFHRKLEVRLFSLLPAGFLTVDLSPLSPLGTTGLLTTVHPNNVVSTIRNLEVTSDTTLQLALECAQRRQVLLEADSKNNDAIKLCSSQRVVRAQPLKDKKFSAHFNLLGLCTAGRDTGNLEFDRHSLDEHLKYYFRVIEMVLNRAAFNRIILKFFIYGGNEMLTLARYFQSSVLKTGHVDVSIIKNSESGKNYYSKMRFMIDLELRDGLIFNYIDGGFTDWSSKLLNNNKEKLLISGMGTDLLFRTIDENYLNIG